MRTLILIVLALTSLSLDANAQCSHPTGVSYAAGTSFCSQWSGVAINAFTLNASPRIGTTPSYHICQNNGTSCGHPYLIALAGSYWPYPFHSNVGCSPNFCEWYVPLTVYWTGNVPYCHPTHWVHAFPPIPNDINLIYTHLYSQVSIWDKNNICNIMTSRAIDIQILP